MTFFRIDPISENNWWSPKRRSDKSRVRWGIQAEMAASSCVCLPSAAGLGKWYTARHRVAETLLNVPLVFAFIFVFYSKFDTLIDYFKNIQLLKNNINIRRKETAWISIVSFNRLCTVKIGNSKNFSIEFRTVSSTSCLLYKVKTVIKTYLKISTIKIMKYSMI